MSHHHHHAHGAAASRKLLIASIATAAFVVVEIVVGIRANSLALICEAMPSAGIVASALLILRSGALFWDPAVSIAIGVLILWSSWGILREAINLLLEGTPEGIDPEAVTRAIAALDGVHGVPPLHTS